MKKGIYALILRCPAEVSVRIGALGEKSFAAGWYIYVGSALGSGGLDRVCRHIRFYRERYRRPKWHIDYLMERIELTSVIYAATEERLECVLSRAVGGEGIEGFGCSDCACGTHLYFRLENPGEEIRGAFESIGLCPKELGAGVLKKEG
ncbi:MAG TPA: GIY-YIG nuclease family protein [Methanocorpusculum sp.]|nr:GIY-YIG nuclease family protein [Methanocorpusculum sp.]